MVSQRYGFTLIELAIVLVIIGLVVGGVLVGQNLIAAAETRAQITQIEKYNSAVNTFKGKFNYLPGDIVLSVVSQYGFSNDGTCNGTPGRRNGDGLLNSLAGPTYIGQGDGETGLFWVDISSNVAGNLIDGTFPGGGATINCVQFGFIVPVTAVGNYLPAAKIGHGNYVYVYSLSGANWYGLSAPTQIFSNNTLFSSANISVIQAYNIDKKVDDGVPDQGNVVVNYINASGNSVVTATSTSSAGGNATSCYDTTTDQYSVTYNGGNNGNCALSFKFQ